MPFFYMKQKWSISFYFWTDKLTKCINQTLKCYLQEYVNYLQKHKRIFLPLAEFAHNNLYPLNINIFHIIANYQFYSRFNTSKICNIGKAALNINQHMSIWSKKLLRLKKPKYVIMMSHYDESLWWISYG